MRLFLLYYIVQIIICLILLTVNPDFTLEANGLEIFDFLPKLSFIIPIIGLSIIIGTHLAVIFNPKYNHVFFYKRFILAYKNKAVERFSDVFTIFFTFSFLFPLFPNLPAFFRIIFLSFQFTPLFIGFVFSRLSIVKRSLWILLFIVNVIVNLVQGSRGVAVIPIALWAIGFLVSQSKKNSFKITLAIYLALGIPFLSIFARIQDFRDYYGRGIEVTSENVTRLFDFIANDFVSYDGGNAIDGLKRFLNVGDMSIIAMTPDPVEYRMFDELSDEIKEIYTLYGAEGALLVRERRGSIGIGTGILNNYGFNITEMNNVGMGLLGDSYSRFGIIGVTIYFIIITVIISSLEITMLRRKRYNNITWFVVYLFLIYTTLYTLYGSPYFSLFKKLLYNGTFVFLVSYFLGKRIKYT